MKKRDLRQHPLFWVPDDEFQRFNEWCPPKTFSFGDMDIMIEKDFSQISENYFRCAETLIGRIFKNEIEDFVAQFPILYLLRHAFEIRLKLIIFFQTGKLPDKEHSLHKLMNKIDGMDKWAQLRIQELNAVDPSAELLRYGGVGEKAKGFLGTELTFFHEAMRELWNYLHAFSAAYGSRSVL